MLKLIARIPFWVVCVVVAIELIGFAVAAVAVFADWPYRPERYVDRVDPLRAGMAWGLLAGVVLFALFAAASFAGWRLGMTHVGRALGVFWAGTTITAIAMLLLIVSMPPVHSYVVPIEIRIPFFAGIAIAALGFTPQAYRGAVAAIRRRDIGMLAVVLVVAALALVSLIGRR